MYKYICSIMCSYMYNKLRLLLYHGAPVNDKMQINGDHWPIWPNFMNNLFFKNRTLSP